jgi:enoyl-CoA hydratase
LHHNSRTNRLNAIDDRMPRELRAAVERVDADPDVRVIIITGSGKVQKFKLREQLKSGALDWLGR